ncbi:MAG: head GIN domain-containing protein [Flavobacteriales bacterium]
MELKRLIPLCVLLFAGCDKEQMDDCITSTGPMREEVRMLAGFHTVEMEDRLDLLLEQRTANTVAIEAGLNLIGQVITEVRDSVLYVRNDNRCNWVRSFKPRITVKVPVDAIGKLVLRGTGNVTCGDTIQRSYFLLEQWGAQGSAVLTMDVGNVDIALHTGAGDVTIYGRCSATANLYSGIMGPIDASGMRARFVNVNNSGVTDIRCWVDNVLDVQVRDAGDVYYRGEPYDVRTQVIGSGEVIHE